MLEVATTTHCTYTLGYHIVCQQNKSLYRHGWWCSSRPCIAYPVAIVDERPGRDLRLHLRSRRRRRPRILPYALQHRQQPGATASSERLRRRRPLLLLLIHRRRALHDPAPGPALKQSCERAPGVIGRHPRHLSKRCLPRHLRRRCCCCGLTQPRV